MACQTLGYSECHLCCPNQVICPAWIPSIILCVILNAQYLVHMCKQCVVWNAFHRFYGEESIISDLWGNHLTFSYLIDIIVNVHVNLYSLLICIKCLYDDNQL